MRNWDAEIAKLLEWGFTKETEYADFNNKLNEGDMVFYHRSQTRQNIAVVLCEGQHGDVDYLIYVRTDVGCEYVMMPFDWSNLDYKWLNCLKMSLDGVGLKGEKFYE